MVKEVEEAVIRMKRLFGSALYGWSKLMLVVDCVYKVEN